MQLQKNIQFQLEEAIEIPKWADAYPEHKFTVFKTCFLSTKENSHKLKITNEVLKECAKTILGNFLVAKLEWNDATTHKNDEVIYGYYPMEQEIEFVEEDDVLKAYAYAVVSKKYSKEFNGIFEFDNMRNSSVEMTVVSPEDDENQVDSFDIYGLTCLGKTVNGSCPDADITMIRFAQEDAEKYFKDKKTITTLEQFMKERNQSMAVSYKIDKSKEAMSEKAWGDVDKTEMRNKIMEAENKAELVKAVYMLVEEGWEEAPSEHLKYPVMELKGDTFVYNRYGLSSALAYAKQENEESVVNKVEKIYKSLDLDDSDGKEEKKMGEIDFAAVNISDMWSKIYNGMREKREWDYCIHGVYEEANQKFAIVCDDSGKLYRLDFSLTEEGLTLADEIVEVREEFVETENMKKFAEPEDADSYKTFAEEKEVEEEPKAEDEEKKEEAKEAKMSEEDMLTKIAELEAVVEEKENIIMEKDKLIGEKDEELEVLKKFKQCAEDKEKAMFVETTLSSMVKFMDNETMEQARQEGLSVNFAELDAWANKVKASIVDKVVNSKAKKADEIFDFAAPVENKNKELPKSVWDRL